jgi:hypothetical protein
MEKTRALPHAIHVYQPSFRSEWRTTAYRQSGLCADEL